MYENIVMNIILDMIYVLGELSFDPIIDHFASIKPIRVTRINSNHANQLDQSNPSNQASKLCDCEHMRSLRLLWGNSDERRHRAAMRTNRINGSLIDTDIFIVNINIYVYIIYIQYICKYIYIYIYIYI